MDSRQLRYFVQIVESGSFSKASRQLFVAQPALSAHVAKMEDEIGTPLLVRSVHGVVPTENGLALFQHAKFVLRQLEEAVFVARQNYANIQGRVTLGLAQSTSSVVGLPLLNHLAEVQPGIVLNLVSALPGHLDDMARASQLDVAILFSSTAASEMTCEPLLDEEIFLMVPTGSDLLPPQQTSVCLSQIAELPLVTSSATQSLRRRLILEFERAKLRLSPVAEIDSLQLVMQHCLDQNRATIQPRAATLVIGDPQAWRCLPIQDIGLTRSNFLCAQPPHRLSTAATVVKTELRRIVHDLVQSQRWQSVHLTSTPDTSAA